MRFLRLCIALVLLSLPIPALAQKYPDRPIRLIVPFPPGQATDILARLLGEKLAVQMGQPVVIDNRSGAGGIIGTEAGARAVPDGYTLVMLSSGPVTVNPYVYNNVPYDPVKDFTPIANLAATAHVLVVRPDFPAKTLAELIAMVKAKPGQYNFASPGAGTSQHLTMEMFRYRAGLEMTHVPYRGSAPAQVDLLSGQVPMLFDTITSVTGLVKDGKLRMLVVSTPERSPFVPEVPTVAESGVPGFSAGGWIGIAGPAGMPAPIVDKLNAEIVKALATPEMQERLKAMAFIPIGDSPAHFAAYIKTETTKFSELIKAIGLKLD